LLLLLLLLLLLYVQIYLHLILSYSQPTVFLGTEAAAAGGYYHIPSIPASC
jgi:hypothetical protein